MPRKSKRMEMWSQMASMMDPEGDGLYPEYANNYLGFIREVMGDLVPDILIPVIESFQENEITIVKSATGTGKSWLASRLSTSFYKINRRSQTYLIAAPPKENLTNNLLSKIETVKMEKPVLFMEDNKRDMTILYRAPEQFVKGLVIPKSASPKERETQFSGRHAENMSIFFDEADAIPDEIFAAVDGWTSGGITRQIMFFNPKLKSGYVWDMIESGVAHVVTLSAFDHINVITGDNVIPGAVTRQKTLDRIHRWTRPVERERAGTVTFYVPDYLVGAVGTDRKGNDYEPLPGGLRMVNEDGSEFAYKVLGEFAASDVSKSIPEEWISAARSRWDQHAAMNIENDLPQDTPPALTKAVMGVDVADGGNDDSIIVFRYGFYVPKLLRQKKMDADDVADWATEEWLKVEPDKTSVDGNGVGAAVPKRMTKQKCKRVAKTYMHGKSYVETDEGSFASKRDELLWKLRNWLKEGGMLPPDRNLIAALRVLEHQETRQGIKFSDKKSLKKMLTSGSPDELDALALTMDDVGNVFGGLKKPKDS